jgi:drug/metabolite transporter (DMT)-like permease
MLGAVGTASVQGSPPRVGKWTPTLLRDAFGVKIVSSSGPRTTALAPSIAIVVSTVFWGTLWIPLRHLSDVGLGTPWATAAGFTLPLLLLLPVGILRWRPILAGGWPLAQAGFLMAACIALYAEALLRGNVARVILLFYLTPVWSTLLARAYLGERITGVRLITIALGLLGMFVVFGIGNGLPVPRSVAEWMGLFSGFSWGWSMVYMRRAADASELDKVFVQYLFLGALFVLLTLVPGGRPWGLPTPEVFLRSTTWLLLFGLIWMPVVLWLTMFGGSRLEPGRVAVLLMLEVVIGLASAALLTDEPIGQRELVGAVCIVAACGSELFGEGPSQKAKAKLQKLKVS